MKISISKPFKLILLIQLLLPLLLLSLGIYHGLLQTLYRSGMISQTSFAALNYYQGLTLHGVINAVVLTTFFGVAFGNVVMRYYLDKPLKLTLAWISTALMVIGTLMAAWAMLTNQASVLYTFYPPLKAHPVFYLGVALLVVGSWAAFFSWIIVYRSWVKENPDKKVPIAVLGMMVNFIIWFVCTLPVAYEVLGMLFPWSMGWIETINISLARTLFWFFGHAMVYFWLLPAYVMFYAILPPLAGGKLYSENAGRLVFLLFLILSIPIGVHHQFSEPSITRGVKLFQSLLTFGVAIPSFITAFTVAASMEYGAWKKGTTGYFGWIFKQPFFNKENYMFAYLITGLIIFIFGGLTGIVNASYSLNNVVHNTGWMPGHFHMTVGGPVFLAIIGMSLYIYERISGRPVRMKKTATIVPYIWMAGLFMFSSGLMWGGLIGEPRRTNLGLSYLNPDSPLYRPEWVPTTALAVLGGMLMFAAAGLFFIVLFHTMLGKKQEESHLSFPVLETVHEERKIPLLNNLKPWIIIMIVIIALAYIPAFKDVFKNTGPGAPPYSPENPVPELRQPPKE